VSEGYFECVDVLSQLSLAYSLDDESGVMCISFWIVFVCFWNAAILHWIHSMFVESASSDGNDISSNVEMQQIASDIDAQNDGMIDVFLICLCFEFGIRHVCECA